jgi:hypothetical protein
VRQQCPAKIQPSLDLDVQLSFKLLRRNFAQYNLLGKILRAYDNGILP